MKYYIGIDGGGTKTEFVLADETGKVLSKIVKQGSNPNDIGIEKSYTVLSSGLKELLQGREIPKANLSIFAGIAGAGVGTNAELLRILLMREYDHVGVGSDLVNALELSLGGEDGVAVICGTGISCCICKGGAFKIVGGYGYLFEEGGSGYAYGRDAITAALKYEDGFGEKTVLLEELQKHFGQRVRASLVELLKRGKGFIASFCPLVFQGCTAGDSVCKKIIEKNLAYTVELIKSAIKISPTKIEKIAFVGSVSKEPLFQEKMKSEFEGITLIFCAEKPVWGAVRKARAL